MGTLSTSPFSPLHSIATPIDFHTSPISSSFNHQLKFLSNTNVMKSISTTRRRDSFTFFTGAEKHSKFKIFRVDSSSRTSSSQTQMGTWENPDGGSGSEDEEDEGKSEEEQDLVGFQSEWEDEEEEKDAPAAIASVGNPATKKYEDDIVKEVEQLLDQEEKAILQKHAAPDMKKLSTEKWSPLHTLALSGLATFMDKLVEEGLDINFVDKDGLTALHIAIIAKKEAVISHLLRKGASPHVRDGDGATPLHYAVQVGTKRIVKLLLKYKVDVNVSDNDGWTPLHIAIQSRNRDIAKILLVSGADKSMRNKDGRTPLDLGFCYGKDFKSYDLTKLLKTVPMDREF